MVRANEDAKCGDRMRVIHDSRAAWPEGENFKKHIGEIGTVTYTDYELISLKFDSESTSIAYWRSEVEKV